MLECYLLSACNFFLFVRISTEFVSKPITYDISDFKRRPSLEESLQPSGIVKRKAGEVPFQSETEFNGKLIEKNAHGHTHSIFAYFFLSYFNVFFFLLIFSIESKPDHPEEDEVYFSNSRVTSPRLVN